MSCITHHHACNCREARFKELEAEIAMLREVITDLIDDLWVEEQPEHWCEGKKCNSCRIWNEAIALKTPTEKVK